MRLARNPEGSGMRASIGSVAYLLFPFIFIAVLIVRAAKARPPWNQNDAVKRYAAARSAVAAVLVIAWAGTLLASVLADSYYFASTFTASVFLLLLSIFHSWIWDRVQPGPPGWKDVVANWARPLPDLPSSLSVSARLTVLRVLIVICGTASASTILLAGLLLGCNAALPTWSLPSVSPWISWVPPEIPGWFSWIPQWFLPGCGEPGIPFLTAFFSIHDPLLYGLAFLATSVVLLALFCSLVVSFALTRRRSGIGEIV